jgi:hypothetical protein
MSIFFSSTDKQTPPFAEKKRPQEQHKFENASRNTKAHHHNKLKTPKQKAQQIAESFHSFRDASLLRIAAISLLVPRAVKRNDSREKKLGAQMVKQRHAARIMHAASHPSIQLFR